MRRKRCIFDMIWHIDQELGCCEYCDELATHFISFGFWWGRGWRFVCEKHFHEWMKGELYI